MATQTQKGEIYRVAGPVVTVTGIKPRMYDVVFVGDLKLMGEVIQLVGRKASFRCTKKHQESGQGSR